MNIGQRGQLSRRNNKVGHLSEGFKSDQTFYRNMDNKAFFDSIIVFFPNLSRPDSVLSQAPTSQVYRFMPSELD